MKTTITLSLLAITLTACNTQPIAERVASKPAKERNAYLLSECEDESWRGHDAGNHYHYLHKPENKAHVANVKSICNKLAKPSTDKKALVTQCKVEAAKGTYASKYIFEKHVENLTQICDAFIETKKHQVE